MKKKKNQIYTVLSLDKKPGGISTMIQISSSALSLSSEVTNIILTDQILRNQKFLNDLNKIKNSVIKNIGFINKIIFKFGFVGGNIKKILKKTDIIFIHNSKLLKLIRAQFPKKKIVLFFHTDKVSQLKYFKYADRVVTVNTTMEKKINSVYCKKAIYIPNSIHIKYENNTNYSKEVISDVENKLVIGSMGRLIKKKGFDFLIKTCQEIENIELLIAGDGKEHKYLKNISYKSHNIKLLGWIENKELFFNKIDVFCCSSYEEPFGIVIIEAMARGIPVISTNCNGPKDIINNNKNGLLIEKNNKQELKNAITRLKDDLNLRNKLGVNAMEKYKKKFTFKKYTKNINSLIRKL